MLLVLVLQSNTLPRRSAPGGLLKHLLQCELQPMDVRHRAVADPSQKQKGQQGSSPSHSGYTSFGLAVPRGRVTLFQEKQNQDPKIKFLYLQKDNMLTDLNMGLPLPSPHFGLPQPIQNSRHFHPYLNTSFESSFPPSPSPTFQ